MNNLRQVIFADSLNHLNDLFLSNNQITEIDFDANLHNLEMLDISSLLII